ncbi:MAG: ABC transporter ATP-binding protein [Opitutaceae bacterium]|jgi:ABC-2 type transport system ATP-binding protein
MNPIEIENLTHFYGRTEAVHELNLSVTQGSVCALLGPNGAGKTTTLKVLVNLLFPKSGCARVLGVDSRKLGVEQRRQIGYLDESQQMPKWMTVRQLLDYCRHFYPAWDMALEAKLLKQFDLPVDRKLQHLSRGVLMKTMLVSVLAFRPKLLLLDEPFSGFDPVVREDVTRGLLEAAQAGEWTVLLSSHDIEEVERLADRIAMIDEGRLKLSESVEDLLRRFRRVEVDLQDGPALLGNGQVPESWLSLQRAAGRVCFVESRHNHAQTEAACRRCFPEAAVKASPMTLREIYLAMARKEPAAAEASVT